MNHPLTKNKKIFNKNFNSEMYKLYNPDLQYLTEQNLLKHFMQRGRHERRISCTSDLVEQDPEQFYIDYKIIYPDLIISEYRELYEDLKELTDKEAVFHYHNHGTKESRHPNSEQEIAKLNDLQYDVEFYGNYYLDLCSMTHSQLNNHFLTYGLNEKRIGSFELFLQQMKVDMNILKRFNPSPDKIQLMDTMNNGTLARWIMENNEKLTNNPKYKTEFTISDRITDQDPNYQLLVNHEHFRAISSWTELKEYTSKSFKKYDNSPFGDTPWVYNINSFYKNYPEFDIKYYQDRYLKEHPHIVELDVLIYYHTMGRIIGHAINNKYTIVFYSPLYLPNSGGIRAIYNVAKSINQLHNNRFNAKLYDIHDKTYTNPIFNEIIYTHELHDNCIAVYPEVIRGNPLNCNYVIRWILLALGIETPHSIKEYWGPKDLVYHWEPPHPTDKILKRHIINEDFKKLNNKPRTQNCYLIKKGRLIENNNLSRHPKNCVHLDSFTECVNTFKNEVMINIFNKSKVLYCYDLKTMWIVYAIFCGCAVVLIPPPVEHTTEEEYFNQSLFNYNGVIHRDGVSWGDHPRDIDKAIETVDQEALFLRYMFKQEYKYINNLILTLSKTLKIK